MAKPEPNARISIGSLRTALSEERLSAYDSAGDRSGLDSVARYIWNIELSCAIKPILHVLEVTFRNHLFSSSRKVISEENLHFKEVQCWLDTDPTLLEVREEEEVLNAKDILRRGKKPLTAGRLISKLGFGFWLGLCKRPYEQGRTSGPRLWPDLVKSGFPFLPREKKTRNHIFHHFDSLRDFRNRVFHYEPIWDRDVARYHARALEGIGWMNKGLADVMEELSTLTAVAERPLDNYRKLAATIVKDVKQPAS